MALEVGSDPVPARAQDHASASHDAAGADVGKLARAQFIVCGNLFEVDARYVPIKPVGKGAYGVVWCAHLCQTAHRAPGQPPEGARWCQAGGLRVAWQRVGAVPQALSQPGRHTLCMQGSLSCPSAVRQGTSRLTRR